MEALDPPKRFIRDGTTWLGYLLMGSTTFAFATLGPMMPFFRAELQLNLTIAAYHFSAWSMGGLVAGSVGDRIINKFGRFAVIWCAAVIVSLSLLVIVFAHNPAFTIAAALAAGVSASTMGMCINSLMSNRFGSERAMGITEANIIGSIVCSAAPLVVSTFVRSGMGWRPAMMLPILSFILLFITMRSRPVEHDSGKKKLQATGGLPAVYWAYWSVIVLSVACEWSIVLWSAEFLEKVTGLVRTDAVACVSAFLSAMLIGRLIGRKLAGQFSIQTLLPYAAVVGLVGFLMFWLSHSVHMAILGLFISGLGISNFYPLTLSAALSVAPNNATTATARVSIGTGCAVLFAPLALGFVADHKGVFAAYGIIAILLTMCIGMVFVANRHARKHSAANDFEMEPLPVALPNIAE